MNPNLCTNKKLMSGIENQVFRCSILKVASLRPREKEITCALSSNDLKNELPNRKAVKVMDRRTQLACGAALQVIKIREQPDAEVGIAVAAGAASLGEDDLALAFSGQDCETTERIPPLLEKNLQPLWLLGRLPNMMAAHLAIQFRIQGPSQTCGGGSLAGVQALSCAMRWLQRGEAKAALVGATESYLEKHLQVALRQKQRTPSEAATFFYLQDGEVPEATAYLEGSLHLSREQFDEIRNSNQRQFSKIAYFVDADTKEAISKSWRADKNAVMTWRVGEEMECLASWIQEKVSGTVVRLLDEENAIIFSVMPKL